ncbi:hypothetical protein RND71_009808 [Anisodus tanguticus]|uniref:Uncharacterized protein n=1 Tax=Anisodus tanguticus TaxID=243964 RepID=A0AAE1SG37_9SOLA|nr:hypothetical protein RND71_009808 [Anisodus tanguticus]
MKSDQSPHSSSNSDSPRNSNDLVNTFHFKSTAYHNFQNTTDFTNKRSAKRTSTGHNVTNACTGSDSRTRDKYGGTHRTTRQSKGSKQPNFHEEPRKKVCFGHTNEPTLDTTSSRTNLGLGDSTSGLDTIVDSEIRDDNPTNYDDDKMGYSRGQPLPRNQCFPTRESDNSGGMVVVWKSNEMVIVEELVVTN